MKRCIHVLAAVLISLASVTAAAAEDFPNKPIQLIIGFRSGGGIDTMGRMLAESLTKELGQPVVVQNKPGGGGNLGTTVVKNNKADGYTISVIPAMTMVFNPKAMKTKYTPEDFSYLGAGSLFQEAFVVKEGRPYKTFEEMIEWAKKENKKLRYASVVPIDTYITKAISKDTGVIILPVPTKGTAAAMTSVLGDHVDFGFSGGPHYQYVKAGRMNILMGLGSKRLSAFQDVPTIVELGWNMPIDNYLTAFVRKETPEPIKKKLAEALAKAFQSEKFLEVVNKMNMVPEYLDAGQAEEQIELAKKSVTSFGL